MNPLRFSHALLILVWMMTAAVAAAHPARGPQRFSAAALSAAQPVPVNRDTTMSNNPTGAMIRSAVFPGWGQWYNGKKWKAALVFAVEVGLVANAVRLNQKVVKSTRQDEREFWQDQRNLQFWWLLAAKLLSMLDAYIDAHLADFDESPTVVSVMPEGDGQVWLRVALPLD